MGRLMSKLLAKLTASGQNWSGVPGGSKPEVTAADVAAAMAGVNDRIQYHLMMIRGADQWPSKDETEMILQEIQHLIVAKKTAMWMKGGGPETLRQGKVRRLAEGIWAEATIQKFQQKHITEGLGVSKRTWQNQYRAVYFEVVKEIESRFTDGVRRVSRSVYSDL
jgi:hypothetical protein